jgi:hypothetical protein
MDTFHAHHADILDPAQQPRVIALLRDHGLVTFTGITDRTTLASAARRLMSIRPHRDAGPDGVTVITDTQTADPGYTAFTDAELIPHTDGTSLHSPPGLLVLTCQQPARAEREEVVRVIGQAQLQPGIAAQRTGPGVRVRVVFVALLQRRARLEPCGALGGRDAGDDGVHASAIHWESRQGGLPLTGSGALMSVNSIAVHSSTSTRRDMNRLA